MTQDKEHEDSVSLLMDMGLGFDQAERALKRWGTVAAAADGYFSGGLDQPSDDDVPPPLVDAGELPPAYNPFGPSTYTETVRNTTPTPTASTEVALWAPPPGPPPSNNVIDLTGEDDKNGTAVDEELARALKLSTETAGDDLDKAMALSMSDLRGNDAVGAAGVTSIPAEQRVRVDNEPVILRTTSPLLGTLSSYLQCLFALPTWRKAVLEYRPTQQDLGSRHTFAGFWKGDEGEQLQGSLAGPEDKRWVMIALQRLFALMIQSRRSFIHISEVCKVFPHIEDLSRPGTDGMSYIKSLHIDLVERFRKASDAAAPSLMDLGEEDPDAQKKMDEARFCYHGREVPNDQYINILPPQPDDEHNSIEVTELSINVSSSHPETLYSAIDSMLVRSSPEGGEDTTFALLTTIPDTLVIKLDRRVNPVMNLDGFGAGEQKKHLVGIEETLWLDRYFVGNRMRIAEGRRRVRELGGELEKQREARRRLAVTEDGKDGVELIRKTVTYFEQATAVDASRQERQTDLAKQYRSVLDEMERKIAEYDLSTAALQKEMDAVFDNDDMRRVGPYQLCAILMRNGLNGRGSTWSVVKDTEGRWWKISDLSREEISLEKALKDTSGIHMNAGASMLFYQRTTAPLEFAEIPPLLQDLALEDNHSFAVELPSSITASWDLAPLRERTPSPASTSTMEQSQIVDEIVEFPRDEAYSPPAVDLTFPEAEAMEVTPPPQPQRSDEVKEKSVGGGEEIEHFEVVPVESEEMLRLRGGGGDDGEEEEGSDYDDEDEEFDEDEVELGCLEPMPEVWDVDYAVGKVGGLPVYLDPTSPLAPKDVECGVCAGTMSLLLQVNSPDDERPHAAARALYVYACPGKECFSKDSSKAAKLWRVQMPSPNAFFPHTTETQARRKALEEALVPNMGLSGPPSSSSSAPWPEWDIVCESEPYEESYLPDPIEKSAEDGVNGEDAAEPDTRTGVDAAFLAFQERIERVPQQVLRFYRLPDVSDPQPLWANNHRISAESIPPCKLCGGARGVEFQVISTLLNFLKDDHLHFDSLLAYTCVENCPIPARAGEGEEGAGWVEEYLVEDVFTEAGVDFGQQQQQQQ